MGRRNTLTKTQNTARMLMNLKETLKSHSSRESGAVGPLEASRGAEVARASDLRALNRLFITCRPRRAGSKPQQRGVTQVLRRPVEPAAKSGRSQGSWRRTLHQLGTLSPGLGAALVQPGSSSRRSFCAPSPAIVSCRSDRQPLTLAISTGALPGPRRHPAGVCRSACCG